VDKKQLKQQALDEATAICRVAEEQERDFTNEERKKVDTLLATAKQLGEEIVADRERSKSGDAAMVQAIMELTGNMPGMRGQDVKGVWGAAFLKNLNMHYAGRKELLPMNGTLGVPSPIRSIAALSDVGRAESLLQFIPSEPAGVTDAVSYLREIERTHRAAPVAVGAVKPVSTYELERVDARIKTIAHLSEPVSRNWLADAPLLAQYIDGVLREGLNLEVEDQILNGDGLGENFLGVSNTPLVQVQPFDTDPIVTARRAITRLEDLPCTPTGFVFNPDDWETVELLPDLLGGYVMGQGGQGLPVDRARRRLWGLPVALSVRATPGVGILGDWTGGSRIWPREDVRIDWSEAFLTEGFSEYDVTQTTGFSRNLVQFRAELRTLFAVLIGRRFVLFDTESGS
jgi:HK97 family phage major capsid protein